MESDKKLTTEVSQKTPEIISFFEKDAGFVFVYKKTEKLASAVYMVTGLFSDNEPMKWTLRKKVSELLSFIINYKDSVSSNYSDFVYNVKTRVLELVSLLEISNRGALISEMNFSILKAEFTNLIDSLVSTNLDSKESSQNISKDFFNIKSPQPRSDHFYSSEVSYHSPAKSFGQMSDSSIKDKDTPTPRDEFKRSNRQNIILGLLKKKKELTIKDIAAVIKDCSEKTIQRELISFMEAGIIKRTGERRWSKYSLA